MTYSLVNMPVLGFDLCRLAGGSTLAGIVLAALQLDEPGLDALAARPRRPGRRPAAVPAMIGAVRGSSDVVDAATDSRDAARVLHDLEHSMIGDFDALVRLVRDDILSWTWHEAGSVRWQLPAAVDALDHLVDALADAYGHGGSAAALGLPRPATSEGLDLGPCGPAVRDLLDRTAAMTPDQTAQLRALVGARASRGDWAAAVHDASWAVYLTDRLRVAAAVQLLAVRAFSDAGFTARDGAYGVWNEISGAVQAAVVADILPGETHRLLTERCHVALAMS